MPLIVPRPPCWTATVAVAARSTIWAAARENARSELSESAMTSSCCCFGAHMTSRRAACYWPDGQDEWRHWHNGKLDLCCSGLKGGGQTSPIQLAGVYLSAVIEIAASPARSARSVSD